MAHEAHDHVTNEGSPGPCALQSALRPHCLSNTLTQWRVFASVCKSKIFLRSPHQLPAKIGLAQTDLELLNTNDLSPLSFLSARITGMHYYAWPQVLLVCILPWVALKSPRLKDQSSWILVMALVLLSW